MPKQTLRGIVVCADSLADAKQQYGEVATGENCQPMADRNGNFVVLASSRNEFTMMNPNTGELDMVPHDGITERLKFVASASELSAHYTACAACESHILADDPELVQKCPVCVSDIDMNAAPESNNVAVASGATAEEAATNLALLLNGDSQEVTLAVAEHAQGILAVAGSLTCDPYTGGEPTLIEADDRNVSVASDNSVEDGIEAHIYVCAADCDTPFVASTDDMPVFCPACAGGLVEPEGDDLEGIDFEGTASDQNEDKPFVITASVDEDFDDEDDDSEFDDDEDDDSDFDFGDDEDEDDYEGTASDDGDDDDDDDEDDEDEDDSEEDEDDSDDEDEDEESSVSLSLSSSRIRRRGRSLEPRGNHVATAASHSEDTTTLKASYLAIASEASPETFQVAYAGSIQGENTWFATLNGIPVARAIASETKHPDIFNREVFADVVHAEASDKGIPAALEQFGFQELAPEIEVQDYVSKEIRTAVASQVDEIRTQAETERSELGERVSAALAIAATGINRGFFRNRSNPVMGSLIQSLSAVGIGNAEAIVAKAFADHSDSYHKDLLAQAQEIMLYDKNVQNELAQAVSEAQPNLAVASANSYGPIGRPVAEEQPSRTAATASSASADDFAARLRGALQGL